MAKVEQFLKAIPAFIPTETDHKLRKCSITTLITYCIYVLSRCTNQILTPIKLKCFVLNQFNSTGIGKSRSVQALQLKKVAV